MKFTTFRRSFDLIARPLIRRIKKARDLFLAFFIWILKLIASELQIGVVFSLCQKGPFLRQKSFILDSDSDLIKQPYGKRKQTSLA
ncbi:MAG TPA: hypothetical protein VNB22_22285, partial [Pyrinomonadaceae bacterium]|nr:hypothetical protein [Pyrinomonadaceae bacterium]